MKMKKVSLRELVADKIVYAVLLAMTYWLWARNDWKDYYTFLAFRSVREYTHENALFCIPFYPRQKI